MANLLLHKHSATTGVVPAAAAISPRELAINSTDGRLFTKTAAGVVVEFARKDAVPSGSGTCSGTNTGDQTTITGNAGTATVLSTTRANYKGVTDGVVAGQLMWKNYGNSHTLFDASAGTSPTGTTVDRFTPNFPVQYDTVANSWGQAIVLMGWSGSNTYGVKVDWSRYANSAGAAATATTATNHYGGSGSYIASSVSGTGYDKAIQIREATLAGAAGGAIAYAPRLAFHWSGKVASSIAMEVSGRIAIYNNPGTGYENFIAKNITGNTFASTVSTGTAPLAVASTTLVTNLNAGLLDGIDSTGFMLAPVVINQSAAAYTGVATKGMTIILANTTSNTITVTLPTAVGNTAIYKIKKTAASNTLNINTTSAQTIDGSTTIAIVRQYEAISLVSDNANWNII